jgi:cell division protease FtsH
MLNALRENRETFAIKDVDNILNKMLAGWQPTEHHFNNDIIEHIVIHEMGHAIVGLLAEHHSKMTKVIINFSSPKSPGYTVFEASESTIYTREALFEHLAILLAGRIAEETYSNVSITTGAINDFEEAYKLATKMILYYGMGSKVIYPSNSDKYKEMIDDEVTHLIDEAYAYAQFIVRNSWGLIMDCADILKRDKIMHASQIMEMIASGNYFF